MIIPMNKYSFLIYHKEYESFLNKLQELGVVHVIEKATDHKQEHLLEYYRQISQVDKVLKFLNQTKQHSENSTGEKRSSDSPAKTVEIVIQKQQEFDQVKQKLQALQKELAQSEPWGDFSAETISDLADHSIDVFLFTCNEKAFKYEWLEKYPLEIINQIGPVLYLVFFRKPNGDVFDIPIEPHVFPNRPAHEILDEIDSVEKERDEINRLFADLSQDTEAIEKYRKELQSLYDSQKVRAYTLSEADNRLMVLEGWAPETHTGELQNFLEKENIYYITSKPDEEDEVPILLKNNWFSRLFEPIGELYTLPNYRELDITPFFAPFFMLFFGFCLGDIGYGLIILLITFYIKPKLSPKIRPIITLGQFLGISTIVMGLFSGTFFGMDLLKTNFLFFTSLRFMMLDSKQLMMLSLIIGGIQIVYGIGIKAANQILFGGWKNAISTLGWLFVILTLAPAILLLKQNVISQDLFSKLLWGISIIGAFPILLFNNPGKNIFLNFGLGLWDTYGMVTGLLGDVLSYIRLFALGLSSAVLGQVFNKMAIDMSGHIPVLSQIIMILILLFGHTLNLGLSALGSFVHPLRLTFVEFYKNSGFAGGGKKYNPFKK